MRIFRPINASRLSLLAAALLMTVGTAARAFADTYALSAVAYTQSENFYAGDDFGNYTINLTDKVAMFPNYSCGGVVNPALWYETHYININSSSDLFTTTPPSLWADPNPIAGTEPCSLAPGTGFHAYHVLCANGHMIFAGEYDDPNGNFIRGIWAGSNPDPILNYLSTGSIDGGFMTANGNAFFIDGLHDTLDVALDLSATPVPEPGSFLLLGTGTLSLLGFVRKKIFTAN